MQRSGSTQSTPGVEASFMPGITAYLMIRATDDAAITIHIEMVSARSLRTCFLGSKDWIPRFPPATVRRSGSMERATESGA